MYVQFGQGTRWHKLREDGTLQCRIPCGTIVRRSERVSPARICTECQKKREWQAMSPRSASEENKNSTGFSCSSCSTPMVFNPFTQVVFCPACGRRHSQDMTDRLVNIGR